MAITSTYLIEGVKRRITDPQHQNRLKNGDILAFADQIIQAEIIPIMESAQQDFFVTYSETPIVSGQSEYDIPYRAIGRNFRELKIRNSGDSVNTNFWRNVPLISIENAYIYYTWSNIAGFYFKGDKIRLVPDVQSGAYANSILAMWWRLPPNKLVEFDQVAQVVSVASNVVTVDGVPGDIEAGSTIDFVQGKSGCSIISYDVPVASTSSTTITFATADEVPSELVAGDYICVAGQSYVVNFIPNECYPLLETLTCRRAAQAIADYENLKILDFDAKTERENFKKLIEPRIDGEPTIIVNPRSITRSWKFNQRTWLYGQ
jgi:hypothetical protein